MVKIMCLYNVFLPMYLFSHLFLLLLKDKSKFMLIDCISRGAEGTIDGAYFRTYAISVDYFLGPILRSNFVDFFFLLFSWYGRN
jgi:hypothetical protein